MYRINPGSTEMKKGETVTDLIKVLKARFEKNTHRHRDIAWKDVAVRLEERSDALRSLGEMERTGGEPDVTGCDTVTGEYIFTDCSAESPAGRRSLCYDREGLQSRKDFPPAGSALDMAASMGIELLTEEEYRALQETGAFDTKTSSWVKTPDDLRAKGGALFGDRRYGRVFIYHNGASSYYASRGFRGKARV